MSVIHCFEHQRPTFNSRNRWLYSEMTDLLSSSACMKAPLWHAVVIHKSKDAPHRRSRLKCMLRKARGWSSVEIAPKLILSPEPH